MDFEKTDGKPTATTMYSTRASALPEEPDFAQFDDSPPSTPSAKSSASRDSSMPSRISPPKSRPRAANKSLRDLNGSWVMSKSLSTGIPPALEIQGFSSDVRKEIIASPLRLQITQSHYPSQIFVKQHTSSSIPAFTQRWYPPQRLGTWSDWWESATEGTRSKCRWIQGTDFEHKEGVGYLTDGLARSAEFFEVEVECKSQGWLKREVWLVEGGKRFVRRVVTLGVEKGSEERNGRRAETRLVYEFER
ncbi:hypothetical protein M409DRAFT_24221 [Zasmidium cellare ATCC 36951]|uniref:Lipocalin-like domain-containing protein n=1 Tax=Zasmidium cellare ATCC 36951 TaxID=1080233 RepID=A0A6A6CE60_ZASCE|nr:uncharacterized protein M409DRAFT_24221 [Zasmidium cellare ATCC 36951]KAF2165371.1 hypothetical protein M409DRAFT_24221 [Zasmidium cellare ATCC 36951]